jgi:hypothetical protein
MSTIRGSPTSGRFAVHFFLSLGFEGLEALDIKPNKIERKK